MFVIEKKAKESSCKTIRFPLELIKDIEKIIIKEDISFNKFVIEACNYALENIKK